MFEKDPISLISINAFAGRANRFISRFIILLWLIQLFLPFGIDAKAQQENIDGSIVSLTPFSPLHEQPLVASQHAATLQEAAHGEGAMMLPLKQDVPELPFVSLLEKGPGDEGGFVGCGIGLPTLFATLSLAYLFLPNAAKPNAYAVLKTWVGGTDKRWSNTNNWNPTGLPGTTDTVLFTTNVVKCSLNTTSPDIYKLRIDANYTGTNAVIFQNSGMTITVGAGGFSQAGGTFTGSSGGDAITVNGDFTLSGGSFTSTSGTLSVLGISGVNNTGNFTVSGSSSFAHNNGQVKFEHTPTYDGTNSATIAVNLTASNQLTLYSLWINMASDGPASSMIYSLSSDTLIVTKTYTHGSTGNYGQLNSGVIIVQDSIKVSGNIEYGDGYTIGVGNAFLVAAGSANQYYSSTGGVLPKLIIDKSNSLLPASGTKTLHVNDFILKSGTFSASDTLTINGKGGYNNTGNFTVTGGSFTHNSGIVRFAHTPGYDQAHTATIAINLPSSNQLTFGSLWFIPHGNGPGGSQTYTLSSDTLIVTGSYKQGTSEEVYINSGVILAQGNVSFLNSGSYGGSASMVFTGGAASQTLTYAGSAMLSGAWKVDKTSGSVVLGSNITFPGALQITSGGLCNGASYNLTVTGNMTIEASGTYTDTGTGNLTLGGLLSNSGTVTINGNGTACGGADDIAIASTSGGTSRNWSGSGNFNIVDVTISDQTSTDTMTAYSSTGTAGSHWRVSTGCLPSIQQPQTPYCEGQTTPVSNVTDLTPEFSAIFDDNNTSDSAVFYEVKVYTSTGSSLWSSGKIAISPAVHENNRCADISYNGGLLQQNGTTYYWGIRFWNGVGDVSAWSTIQQFTMFNNSAPSAPQTPYCEGQSTPVTGVTDFTPEFSAVYDDANTSDQAGYYQVQVYSAAAPSGWWNSSWKYRRALVFNNGASAENLANFPVLVVLNSSRVDYANTQNSGQDIRFVDANGSTLLSHEIETWNESGNSLVWVKVPQIDASSNTDSIWMYYGNSGASDGQDKTNVWDANYKVTLHMNETSGSTVYDSKNVNNGTVSGGISTTTGKVSSALSFNGSSQYIDWGSLTGISTGNQVHTVEAWINPVSASPSTRQWLMLLGQEGSGAHSWSLSNNQYGSQFGVWEVETGQTNPVFSASTWTHIVVTNDGTNIKLYCNGDSIISKSTTFNLTSTTLNLAKRPGAVPSEAYYNGYLDEYRLSASARSKAWISAQYKSMTDAYITFRSDEYGGTTVWNSGKTAQTALNENSRCADISYAGSALSASTSYYWRIRFWDNYDADGAWSDLQTFTTAAPARCTWIASANGNWATGANWQTAIPGAGDTAIFDNNSAFICTLTADPGVKGIDIKSTFAGSVYQKSGVTLTIGTGGYSQAGGTFTGNNARITDTASFTVSGGTFTSTSDTLEVQGAAFNVSAGSFTHSSGKVLFRGATGVTLTLGTNGLNIVRVNKTYGTVVMLGSDLKLAGELKLSSGILNQGASHGLKTGGQLTVDYGSALIDTGSGYDSLGGDVSNAGTILIDGGGGMCGVGSHINLRSTDATKRTWSGAGLNSISDVNCYGMKSTPAINAWHSTDEGNNDANWVVKTVCYDGPAPSFTLANETADNAQFGTSVASAGDVNGDGYADVIAGASNKGNGVAYVFYGSASGLHTTPDVTLNNETGSMVYFGYSVASAGDVNGDGYADVIVGAYGNDNHGMAYIFYGSASGLHTTPDVTITETESNAMLGLSVSSAGDVNGDGYADVIVGAPYHNNGGSHCGLAYIFYGGSSMDATPDVTLNNETESSAWFGGSVSSAGDVNGDGYADVIVGASSEDNGGLNCGRAYIYYGGSSMDAAPDVTLNNETTYFGEFGSSVSSAGDVNNDGYSDVIVAAPAASRSYIFYGGASMNATPDVTLTGSSNTFGSSVSSAGDVNDDGYADVIVGEKTISTRGYAYIYYGGASMNAVSDVTFDNVLEANTQFGFSATPAGDVDGNGPSVIIGANLEDNGGTNRGKAYVYTFAGGRSSPSAGYTTWDWIPASQISVNSSGVATINFKVQDYDENSGIALDSFTYSTNGGTTWAHPTNNDNSTCFSANWKSNSYTSKAKYSSATAYNFTWDTRSSDLTGLSAVNQSDVRVRFRVKDGTGYAPYIVKSENFTVNNVARCTWIATANGNWATSANWQTAVPGAGDTAIFDNNSAFICTLTTDPGVKGIDMKSTFAGMVIKKSGVALTVGAGNFKQAGGRFADSSGGAAITINGDFTVSGGSFTSTTGTLYINGITSTNNTGNFTVSGSGAFTHNSGTVKFNHTPPTGGSSQTAAIAIDKTASNSLTLGSLWFNNPQTGPDENFSKQYYELSSDTLVVTGTYTQSGNYGDEYSHHYAYVNTGVIIAQDSVKALDYSNGGTAYIVVNGGNSEDQYYKGSTVGQLGNVIINTSYSLLPASTGATNLGVGDFTLAAGTFSAPSVTLYVNGRAGVDNTGNFTVTGGTFTHNSGTVKFNHTPPTGGSSQTAAIAIDKTASNSLTLGSLWFNNPQTGPDENFSKQYYELSSDTLVVTGTYTQSGNYGDEYSHHYAYVDSGVVMAQGNAAFNSYSYGGSASMVFTGGAAIQTLTYSTTGTTMLSGAWKVDKTAGNVVLGSNITFPGKLRITSGGFSQGASYNVTTGDSLIIGSGCTYTDTGTGDLILAGPLYNAGTVTINSNGTACGGARDILIRSTNTTVRNWAGSGTFSVTDADLQYQSSTPFITAWNSVSSGSVGNEWSIIGVCTIDTSNWYVDFRNGTDGTGQGRSIATAFKTIDACYNNLADVNADSVYVINLLPGRHLATSDIDIDANGPNFTYATPLVIRSYYPDYDSMARVQGTTITAGLGLFAPTVSNVVFERINIRGGKGATAGIGCLNTSTPSRITIKECVFSMDTLKGTDSCSMDTAVKLTNVSNLSITNSVFMGRTSPPAGLRGTGIMASGQNSRIINNTFYNMGYGWSMNTASGSTGTIFANNLFDSVLYAYNANGTADQVNCFNCGFAGNMNPANYYATSSTGKMTPVDEKVTASRPVMSYDMNASDFVKLRRGAELINNGRDTTGVPSRDFYGYDSIGKRDIGATEFNNRNDPLYSDTARLYVDMDKVTDTGNGRSIATAKAHIDSALALIPRGTVDSAYVVNLLPSATAYTAASVNGDSINFPSWNQCLVIQSYYIHKDSFAILATGSGSVIELKDPTTPYKVKYIHLKRLHLKPSGASVNAIYFNTGGQAAIRNIKITECVFDTLGSNKFTSDFKASSAAFLDSVDIMNNVFIGGKALDSVFMGVYTDSNATYGLRFINNTVSNVGSVFANSHAKGHGKYTVLNNIFTGINNVVAQEGSSNDLHMRLNRNCYYNAGSTVYGTDSSGSDTLRRDPLIASFTYANSSFGRLQDESPYIGYGRDSVIFGKGGTVRVTPAYDLLGIARLTGNDLGACQYDPAGIAGKRIYQEGVHGGSYGVIQDAYIYSSSSKNNTGGSTELDIGNSNANKILIRAPLFTGYASTMQVPLNAHVDSAFLSLYQYSNTSTGKVEAYRLTRDWTEGTSSGSAGNVCWDSAKTGAAWGTVGADSLKDREPVKTCETQVNSLNAWARWDVTSLVQDWVSGVTNDGLILSDQDGDLTTTLIKYYSSEYAVNKALRPKLVVYYDPDTVTIVKQEGTTPLSQTWDTYLNETAGSQGYNYGTSTSLVLNSATNNRKHILLNYKDLISDNANSILTGANIKKAEISLFRSNTADLKADSSKAYGMRVGFNEGTVDGSSDGNACWNYAWPGGGYGATGASIDANTMSTGNTANNTVGGAVVWRCDTAAQHWATSGVAYGLAIEPVGPINNVTFYSKNGTSAISAFYNPKLKVTYSGGRTGYAGNVPWVKPSVPLLKLYTTITGQRDTIRFKRSITTAPYDTTDDCYIDSSARTTNYSSITDTLILTDTSSTSAKKILLKFGSVVGNITGQIPANSIVDTAYIRLVEYNSTLTANIVVDVYRVNEVWTESQTRWDNRLTGTGWANTGVRRSSSATLIYSGVTLTRYGSASSNDTVNVPVKNMVQGWVNGGANNGVLIVKIGSTSDGAKFFNSEDAINSRHPELVVVYKKREQVEVQNIGKYASENSYFSDADTLKNQFFVSFNTRYDSTDGMMNQWKTSATSPGDQIKTSNDLLPGFSGSAIKQYNMFDIVRDNSSYYAGNVTSAISFTIAESTTTRMHYRINKRPIYLDGTHVDTVVTDITVYPTGQIFMRDSSYAPGSYTSYGVRFAAKDGTGTQVTSTAPVYGGVYGTSSGRNTLHDWGAGFLTYKTGATNPFTSVSNLSSGGEYKGISMSGTKTNWEGATPYQQAFFLDFSRDDMSGAGGSDSLRKLMLDKQYPCIIHDLRTGTLKTNASGDLNSDGFNESEGNYELNALNDIVYFWFNEDSSKTRYCPVFRMNSYTASYPPTKIMIISPEERVIDTCYASRGDVNISLINPGGAGYVVFQINRIITGPCVIFCGRDDNLAVELNAFWGEADSGACDLFWITESELDNAGFRVLRRERATEGLSKGESTFRVVADYASNAFIRGHLTSAAESNYHWRDEGVTLGRTYEYVLEAVDINGNAKRYGTNVVLKVDKIFTFDLSQNYPNPFNPVTTIKYTVPGRFSAAKKDLVRLNIYNIRGQLVKNLVCDERAPNRYMVQWNGKANNGRYTASGVYLYRIEVGKTFVKTKKMVVVK